MTDSSEFENLKYQAQSENFKYGHPLSGTLGWAVNEIVTLRRDQWQPIESAPKDGTPVDLWCKRSWNPPQTHQRSTDMYWCTTMKCWRKLKNLHFVDHMWNPPKSKYENRLIPTHWMPLPEPPD